jgi:hypothetical protein
MITCFLGLLIAGPAVAAVHYVPTDYATIQAAIDASVDGDTVVVALDRYSGPGNCNINFKGKAITVQSTDPDNPGVVDNTVIDCLGSFSTRGFVFQSGETGESKLAGLTITGGNHFLGGGIYCYSGSSPSVSNCVITGNSAVFGGAVAVGNGNSQPVITGCTITANSALVGGGGIYCTGSGPTIESCIIAGNSAPRGGAVYAHYPGEPVIVNCTISANAASVFAGGLYCFSSSNIDISNSILWGNTAPSASEMMVGNIGSPASVNISYCDVQGLSAGVIVNSGSAVNWGAGNINLDPQFTSPSYMMASSEGYTEGDYHLHSGSPCINAGDPAFVADNGQTDIDGEARISGTGVDIGADEVVATVSAIQAKIKIKPKALNRKSKGKWILCSIELESGYNVSDIVVDSIALNDEVKAVRVKNPKRKHKKKLHVAFNRSEVQDLLADAGRSALLTVTGSLQDGTTFQGQETIKIAGRHHNKKHEKVCKK